MDEVWKTLIQAAPWGFVIIVMEYMKIRDRKEERVHNAAVAKEEREERANNAAEKARLEREHDMEKNRLWMATVKNAIDGYKEIVDAIGVMQKDLQEKYEAMGITKDLLDAARRELARRKGNV